MIGTEIELYIKYYESIEAMWPIPTQGVQEAFIGMKKIHLGLQECIEVGQVMKE